MTICNSKGHRRKLLTAITTTTTTIDYHHHHHCHNSSQYLLRKRVKANSKRLLRRNLTKKFHQHHKLKLFLNKCLTLKRSNLIKSNTNYHPIKVISFRAINTNKTISHK